MSKPGESELVEEIGGQTVYINDGGQRRRELDALDPGVRYPQRLRLLGDLVAIRPDAEATVTKGGILVPAAAQQTQYNTETFVKSAEQWHTGVVMGVGPGRHRRSHRTSNEKAGPRVPLDVKVGQRVVYHRASSTGIVWTDGMPVAFVHADIFTDKGKMMCAVAGILEVG